MDTSANMTNKKRPGRPRKISAEPGLPFVGIADEPSAQGNILEVTYDNPLLFKKIFALLKAANVADVSLMFGPRAIRIIAVEPDFNSIICINIWAHLLNRYFVAPEHVESGGLEILVRREAIERIFNKVNNKNANEVIFSVSSDALNSIFNISIVNRAQGSTKHCQVETLQRLSPAATAPADFEVVLSGAQAAAQPTTTNNQQLAAVPVSAQVTATVQQPTYQLHFRLGAKSFKSIFDDFHKSKFESFEISKNGLWSSALEISCSKPGQPRLSTDYSDAAKIALVHNLPNDVDQIFSVSGSVDCMRQFTNTIVGDWADISLSNRADASIRIMSECDRRIVGPSALGSSALGIAAESIQHVCHVVVYMMVGSS
jgi:hypothetical protein